MNSQSTPSPRPHREKAGGPTAANASARLEPEAVLVNHGVPDHPWQPGRGVTPEPQVHGSAVVQNTRMWPWTWIGPDSTVIDSDFRDYAYSVANNQIYNAEVGKFCN